MESSTEAADEKAEEGKTSEGTSLSAAMILSLRGNISSRKGGEEKVTEVGELA